MIAQLPLSIPTAPLSLEPFETAQPLACQFFSQALSHKLMVNTYALVGQDFETMAAMVLRLGQIINCKAPTSLHGKPAACGQCQPCRWIGENAHPGVITLTNQTFLFATEEEPGEGSSKSRKKKPTASQVIKVEQLDHLLQELSHHSSDGFRRIVIIAGADVLPPESHATDDPAIRWQAPKEWLATQDDESPMTLQLKSLDRKLFGETVANKFLKTLEEPPADALFFLLAASEDRLMPTIVSRCQRIPFSPPKTARQFSFIDAAQPEVDTLWFTPCPPIEIMSRTQRFITMVTESGVDMDTWLTGLQFILHQRLKQRVRTLSSIQGGESDMRRAQTRINDLELAKRQIKSGVKAELVIESVFLQSF